MSGPQFIHFQSYSRKPNKVGQSVYQVLAEAAREPEFSTHVEEPKPPNLIYGMTPEQVREKHDEIVAAGFVDVMLKDGTVARRGVRNDRHTLFTAVASYPLLTSQVAVGSANREDYERWIELNVRWLKAMFGDRLVSVLEHVDEPHPHLHAFILPLGDASCSARHLNPAWQVKEDAEALAKESKIPAKQAVKLGNQAYRERGRELQDQYYQDVGLPAGLTRTGPKRLRLSRQQWRAQKDEALRTALTLRQIDEKTEDLADREDALDQSVEDKARDLVTRLEEAEALYAAAEEERALAKNEQERLAELALAQSREAAAMRTAAVKEAAQIKAAAENSALRTAIQANAALAEARRKADRMTQELNDARQAFEIEKSAIVQRAAKEAAAIAIRLIAGVLTGEVGLKPAAAGWYIRDDALRDRVKALDLGNALREVVSATSDLWGRLKGRITAADASDEKKRASDLGQKFDPPTTICQERNEP